VYYLDRGPNVNQTVPFPKGFMILSGDKSARSYDNATMTYGTKEHPGRPVADRVSFNCLDDETLEKPNGMRAQIHFQSCWNGRGLYRQDNSHVAYQSGIDNGICPPTHPVQIPHIFLEVFYDVALVPDQTPDGLFTFSQGDPTGYGFHADFQNGWDQNVLANATANCLATDDFGQISNCPILQESQSSAFGFNCPERPPQVEENVRGLLPKLPGCVKITYSRETRDPPDARLDSDPDPAAESRRLLPHGEPEVSGLLQRHGSHLRPHSLRLLDLELHLHDRRLLPRTLQQQGVPHQRARVHAGVLLRQLHQPDGAQRLAGL
jgi:hypothetical protein